MSVSSLSNSSNCPAQLDIRAVFLFNRDVCMNSPHQNFAVSDHDYCVSMAHYDYIIVKDIPQSNKLLSEQEGAPSVKGNRCSATISPLEQAYDEMSKMQRSMNEQPQQSMLMFADISNELQYEKIAKFWADNSQPVLFMTLVNLNQKAQYPYVIDRIQDLFPSNTMVYYTFDYNDMVIFHKGASFSDYALRILQLDFSNCQDGNDFISPVSDTITLYSFQRTPDSQKEYDEKFHAYLRMGIANTRVMERFKEQLFSLPKYGKSLEVNYILGRHDIGFYQPDATLNWLNSVRGLIDKTTEEFKTQCESVMAQPIWYSSRTLSIRIPINGDSELKKLGDFCWSGSHPEVELRSQMDNAYRNFEEKYADACKNLKLTQDSTWLTWLKNGYRQAISFLESDMMYELGLCLVPLYQDFLTYSAMLWDKLNEHSCSSLILDRYRTDAERNFVDLFQNVSILIDSMNHSSRQFIQTPSFRTIAFSIPPKLMAYYTSVSRQLLKVLQDDKNCYGLMIAPSFVRNLEVISLAQKQLTGGHQLLSIAISEDSIYTLQRTTFYLAHELSHFVGNKNRMREKRRKFMIEACVFHFLSTALDKFMDVLKKEADGNCHLSLNGEALWDELSGLASTIFSDIEKIEKDKREDLHGDSDHQNESGLYLENVSNLACEAIKQISFNTRRLDEVFCSFWRLIKEESQAEVERNFADKFFSQSDMAMPYVEMSLLPSPTIQHLAKQNIKLLYQRTMQNTYYHYIRDETDSASNVDSIADQFRESFADLQAIKLLNISPNDYFNIFAKDEALNSYAVSKDEPNIPKLHRMRVITVLSVLPEDPSFIPNSEIKSLLQALRLEDSNKSKFNELIRSKDIEGPVAYYVCEYLKECLNAISNSFSNNDDVKSLQKLYAALDNKSTVAELMETLRTSTQNYRGILCSKR